MTFCLRLLSPLLLGAAAASATGAELEPPLRTDHLDSRLVAEQDAAVPGQTLRVGLWLQHDPHWHTYWRNPGDSGLPTRIRFELPEGVTAGEIGWPLPERLPVGDLVNFGYSNTVLLPIELQVSEDFSADVLEIHARASWLVCEVECIPGDGEYRLSLPVRSTAGTAENWRADFARSAERQPQLGDAIEATYRITDERVSVDLRGPGLPASVEGWTVFPATAQVIANAAEPDWRRSADGLSFTLPVSEFFAAAPQRFELLLSNGERGLMIAAGLDEAASAVAAAPAAVTGSGTGSGSRVPAAAPGLLAALLLAFAGGMLLNLMPCVFPVLSLKAMGAVEAGDNRREMRSHGLWYSVGVVASFLAIASVLLLLRGSGEALGWGFQLQTPAFVAAMALLLFAMGLSFSGVYEFGAGLGGVGQRLTEGRGARSAFFTGVLACVVASPCTAPFMGSALGFALTQPPWAALSIFAALGAGMAAPMLLLGFSPAVARLLPRPGAWMEGFKQALAFPLYLTVIWLLWVYARQTDIDAAMLLLVALTALAFSLWLLDRARRVRAPRVAVGYRAVAVVLLLASVGLPVLAEPEPPDPASANAGAWSPQRLQQALQTGQPVLVNMTAAWCITCLANERVALSSPSFHQRLALENVLYLKGDWTRRDAGITAYLESFGRSGVPLYVLYPGPGREPVVLPQLLTSDIVASALDSIDTPPG